MLNSPCVHLWLIIFQTHAMSTSRPPPTGADRDGDSLDQMVRRHVDRWLEDHLTELLPREQTEDQRNQERLLTLARQLMRQQFYAEEQTRANGNSGLKAMRLRGEGTRPYHAGSHSDVYTVAAIHDHADFVNTLGMGEVGAVLNGVEFRTRHNDYVLVKKSATSSVSGEVEEIPYPDVPPSVLEKTDLRDQIAELREYFRAWKQQDTSIRDYRPYFKANLCYMEGAWTTHTDSLEEAFHSERHWYAADSWDDLFHKAKFSAYSGSKENLENLAFLPSTLWDITEDGDLVFGQWNYHIFCHPLDDDLPLNRLRAIDDLKTRMSTLMTFDEYVKGRNARFQVNPLDMDSWFDVPTVSGLLDDLMGQIPGMDNYGAVLHDTSFGNTVKDFNSTDGDPPKNVAQYHRWFKNKDSGAMGVQVRHRGFNDENLWVAMNTQHHVLPTKLRTCHTTANDHKECQVLEQKWSYAIPLEIIYTTPLNSWNPYNIIYKGTDASSVGESVTRNVDGSVRDGSNSTDRAYNGTNCSKFYMTPVEFFSGGEIARDPADTPSDHVFVLDAGGVVRDVRASGMRTFLPDIPGVGVLRQRYPIAPLHMDGNPVLKELEALKDIVLESARYGFMRRESEGVEEKQEARPVRLLLDTGSSGHAHLVVLTPYHQSVLEGAGSVDVLSSTVLGHAHWLRIRTRGGQGTYQYSRCDDLPVCADGHPHSLAVL